ncbi:hypothetical protein KSS87_011554 [Heliosperma pusillum]|nr:hypothetical protein KSS87_011554 [Heliosperma pusillum]
MSHKEKLPKTRVRKHEILCMKNNNTNNKLKSKLEVVVEEEVKMASLAMQVKARLRSVDMPLTMQERAIYLTRSFLNTLSLNSTRLNPSQLAFALKKEFDTRYGAAWHCIVGKSYGSYVTHSTGGFLYFSFDSHFILLFKTQVHVVVPPPPKSSSLNQ